MPATNLSVSLLTMTPDAEALIYAACKQCTGADSASDVFNEASLHFWNRDNADIDSDDESAGFHYAEDAEKLIRRVIDSGHTSVVECVQFSFAVSGISRACSHQLVRHRVGCSYAMQSQRYVKSDDFDYVVPPSISNNQEALAVYLHKMQAIDSACYDHLVNLGVPAEDARFVLPNACATKLVVTMNCRALLHFFGERCCVRAQWEIRAMAKAMLETCKEHLPVVFSNAGPKCVRQGFCTEHKSCGRFDQVSTYGKSKKETI